LGSSRHPSTLPEEGFRSAYDGVPFYPVMPTGPYAGAYNQLTVGSDGIAISAGPPTTSSLSHVHFVDPHMRQTASTCITRPSLPARSTASPPPTSASRPRGPGRRRPRRSARAARCSSSRAGRATRTGSSRTTGAGSTSPRRRRTRSTRTTRAAGCWASWCGIRGSNGRCVLLSSFLVGWLVLTWWVWGRTRWS
jgi:hypothetical protein